MATIVDRFQRFYRQTKARFFNFLLRMTADPDLAGDIFQESYARYWERYGRKPPSTGLLFAIGRNAVIDHCRRRRPSTSYEDRCPNGCPDQETDLINKEACRQVLDAMERLEASDREVLALAVDGEFTYNEISRVTGLSLANVKVKVHRARRKLRQVLEEL